MAKIWRNRVVAGDRFFQDCPEVYKPQVLALLKVDVEAGTITADRFEEFTGEQYGEVDAG